MTPPPTGPTPNNTGSWSGQRRSFPKRITRRILQEQPMCQLGYPGCTIDTTEVDHRIGVADALAMGWEQADYDDPSNAQGACASCHAKKTRAEQQRGRERAKNKRANRTRKVEKHPGLTD